MLKAHVFPDLTSNNPYIQGTALWCYGEFANFDFTDNQHLEQVVKLIYQRLFVECLPIKY